MEAENEPSMVDPINIRWVRVLTLAAIGWYLLLIVLHYFNQRPLWNDEACIFTSIKYFSPAQRMPDFMAGRLSKGEMKSTYKPGVSPARLDEILPDFIASALRRAVIDYDKKMRGFISPEALVVGVETKTSSPIVMLRDAGLQSVSHPGLFPSGEGAGFAGGIVSAALDGVRVGRAVLEDAVAASLAEVSAVPNLSLKPSARPLPGRR